MNPTANFELQHLNSGSIPQKRECQNLIWPKIFLALLVPLLITTAELQATTVSVSDSSALVNAVNNGAAGDIINITAGTYFIAAPLSPKSNMIIQGAGASSTTLAPDPSWDPGRAGLPDDGVNWTTANRGAFLFDLPNNTTGLVIRNLTLSGKNRLHGVVFGVDVSLELANLIIRNCIWSGIRGFGLSTSNIHDTIFYNAGGKVNGVDGGAMYLSYSTGNRIWNNRFINSGYAQGTDGPNQNFYGIKTREMRFSRIHNNTFGVGFSLEFPFESDWGNEIDHNYLYYTASLPKYAGGITSGNLRTFRFHHNYWKSSYAIEFPRNYIEIDHNLFDFDTGDDGGNLISSFASEDSPGWVRMHNNRIKNPGRGIAWLNGRYDNFSFYNNHVIANETMTPRTEGLFGFNGTTDFSTVTIKDNIFECFGITRPLLRGNGYNSVIQNNTLNGISDTGFYSNPTTSDTRGPTSPLVFTCGVNGEYSVNEWTISGSPIFDPIADPDIDPGIGVQPIPGTIETESYSSMYGIQTETTTDIGGGLNVGWTDSEDWMDYRLNVATAGTYSIEFRVASENSNTRFQLKRGYTVMANVNVPNTGAWQNWQTVTTPGIQLPAGLQTLRIYVRAGGFNVNWMKFTLTTASSYSNWANDPLKGNIPGKAPEGDEDQDGHLNLMEYALGLNPNLPDRPSNTIVGNVVTYSKGADAKIDPAISYVIERSTDLGRTDPWTPVTASEYNPDSPSVSYTVPSSPRIFLRLRVSAM